jgi:hypothetical protein
MIDYLTYYYNANNPPFQTLSSLSEEEALQIMQALCDDSPFGARFKDPHQYWNDRQAAEQWVRELFIAKGRKPKAKYPICMALGSSPWLERAKPDQAAYGEIRIPLDIFSEDDVSFTFPDSMVSHWFAKDKPEGLYMPDYHGVVFTRTEILALVEEKGLPEVEWKLNMPDEIGAYIEAQVWNHEILADYKRENRV